MQLRSNSVFKPAESKENPLLTEFGAKSDAQLKLIDVELLNLRNLIKKFANETSELFSMLEINHNESEEFSHEAVANFADSMIINAKLNADTNFYAMLIKKQFFQLKKLLQNFSKDILEEKPAKPAKKGEKTENTTLMQKTVDFETCYAQALQIIEKNFFDINKENRLNMFQNLININVSLKAHILNKVKEKEEFIINPPEAEQPSNCIIC